MILDAAEVEVLQVILEAVSVDTVSMVELSPGEAALARSVLHRLRRALADYGAAELTAP